MLQVVYINSDRESRVYEASDAIITRGKEGTSGGERMNGQGIREFKKIGRKAKALPVHDRSMHFSLHATGPGTLSTYFSFDPKGV